MTISSDIAGDWQYIEGIESVTLTPTNPPAAAVPSVKALRRVLNRAAIATFGAVIGIEPSDAPWHLWSATLNGVVPKNGDLITDDTGQKWTILATSFETRKSRYRCLCRKQV